MQQDNQAAEAELQAALKGQDAAKREHDILSKKHQTALQNLKVGMPDCTVRVAAVLQSSVQTWEAGFPSVILRVLELLIRSSFSRVASHATSYRCMSPILLDAGKYYRCL